MSAIVSTGLDAVADALVGSPAEVVVPAPGPGPGYWAGGPSALFEDGAFFLAYRLRRPLGAGRGYANVVARSTDGVHFTPLCEISADDFACASLERPTLTRRADGGWRLYVSCAQPGTKQWWVEAIDLEPGAGLDTLPAGRRTLVLPVEADLAYKDVVVTRSGDRWSMWACRHLLDLGDEHADRMQTWFATSNDGLSWDRFRPALLPEPGSWNARGTRLTAVWPDGDQWCATFDGRATAAENWQEKTGLAVGPAPDALRPRTGSLLRDGRPFRYVCRVASPTGTRLYFEGERLDGAHDLYTVDVD